MEYKKGKKILLDTDQYLCKLHDRSPGDRRLHYVANEIAWAIGLDLMDKFFQFILERFAVHKSVVRTILLLQAVSNYCRNYNKFVRLIC